MEALSIACCAICFDNLSQPPTAANVNPTVTTVSATTSTICALECGHVFHRNCVAQWFSVSQQGRGPVRKCPLCQSNQSIPAKVKTIYLSFQTSFAYDDLKKSYTKSELDRFVMKKEMDAMEAECRRLRSHLETLELERIRQPFGFSNANMTNIPAAPAHNEVQKTALDLRTSSKNDFETPTSAEAPELQPIRRVRMIQRSVTCLNQNSRPPPGSFMNNLPEGNLSPRSRLTIFRSRLHNRQNRPPLDV